MRKVLFSLACLATIGLAQARADVTYKYVTTQSVFTGTAGSKVVISFFLQETLSLGSTSVIFADQGVFGGSVMVTQTSAAVAGDSNIYGSNISNNHRFVANAAASPVGFGGGIDPDTGAPIAPTVVDNSTFAFSNQSGVIVNAESIKNAGQAKLPPDPNANVGPNFANDGAGTTTPVSRNILIGTLNFQYGTGVTTYKITNYTGTINATTFTNPTTTQAGRNLDVSSAAYTGGATPLGGFMTFDVGAAIPEPSSMALCGLIGCGLSYAGYRRKKTIATPTVA